MEMASSRYPAQSYHESMNPESYWHQCIRTWYPELHSRTYFLPPLYFNEVLYTREIVAGFPVLMAHSESASKSWPLNPDELKVTTSTSVASQRNYPYNLRRLQVSSIVRRDRAQQRVLNALRALADFKQPKEVMMVVSQLLFRNYLHKPRFWATSARLPCPNNMPNEYIQGDFDVLIIHSQHGLFTLRIKGVGATFSQVNLSQQTEDDIVIGKIKSMLKQMNKAEVVLKHLTSDLPGINITNVLVMPFISSCQFLRAVNSNPSVGEILCRCLGVQGVENAVKLCLLSDHLSSIQTPSDINSTVLEELISWWQRLVDASDPRPLISPDVYEQLVSRFCGPATTVEIPSVSPPRLSLRTLGEAVSETGERTMMLVLFPQQFELLNRSPPRVFLTGPPGTGKTIVLLLQAMSWMQCGLDVHLVSTWSRSRAVTILIEHQLLKTKMESMTTPEVYRHVFDFMIDGTVEAAVKHLESTSRGKQLCVIADEVGPDWPDRNLTQFCNQLIDAVPRVFLWSASVCHKFRPLCLEEVQFTIPLRSPPVVVREVAKAVAIQTGRVRDYTVSEVPFPTDGPEILRIKHRDGHLCHIGLWSRNCVECGHQVACILKNLIFGSKTDDERNKSPPLQYRDVLVVCHGYPSDDKTDSDGRVTSKASGLVRGLRACQVPVRVVELDDESAIRNTALGTDDYVTVTNWEDVCGLERKVVVVEIHEYYIMYEMLYNISRCSAQLVLIE